jgi:hypothetical protein
MLSHPSKASLVIDRDGTVELVDAKGAKVTLDAAAERVIVQDVAGNSLTMSDSGTVVQDSHGNQIEMGQSGITVRGQQIVIDGSQVLLGGAGGEPLIKGASFLALFATHTHPTAVGPSGPPVATPPGFNSTLSNKVMTS